MEEGVAGKPSRALLIICPWLHYHAGYYREKVWKIAMVRRLRSAAENVRFYPFSGIKLVEVPCKAYNQAGTSDAEKSQSRKLYGHLNAVHPDLICAAAARACWTGLPDASRAWCISVYVSRCAVRYRLQMKTISPVNSASGKRVRRPWRSATSVCDEEIEHRAAGPDQREMAAIASSIRDITRSPAMTTVTGSDHGGPIQLLWLCREIFGSARRWVMFVTPVWILVTLQGE